jgi:hypothetical protein
MKDLKFRVKNPQHSEAIQKRLFELGYEWMANDMVPIHKDAPYLYADNVNDICFGDDEDFHLNCKNTEATLDDLYSPEFLNEDTSNEDSFKKALPELESIVKEMFDAIEKLKQR